MRNSSDTRIAIVMGGEPDDADAVLVEDGHPAPARGHVVRFSTAKPMFGCACCRPRSGAAEALARLYRARVVGDAPMFAGLVVIASPAGESAVTRAVEDDLYCQAKYRLNAY